MLCFFNKTHNLVSVINKPCLLFLHIILISPRINVLFAIEPTDLINEPITRHIYNIQYINSSISPK